MLRESPLGKGRMKAAFISRSVRGTVRVQETVTGIGVDYRAQAMSLRGAVVVKMVVFLRLARRYEAKRFLINENPTVR